MTVPKAAAIPPTTAPEIYAALRAMDGSDAVDRGKQLSRAEAVARRRAELDIVVCGPDEGANWQLAREIETAASISGQRCKAHGPHLGALSLPHWQQKVCPPAGHSFYETTLRKARVNP